MSDEISDEILRPFTSAMRAADQSFEKVGGGTRHYIRDCLWPEMKAHGLTVIKGRGPEKQLEPVAANVTRLERVTRETLILNAHRMAARKFKGQPLWGFITEVCAVGSRSAVEICRELGWNPHQDASIHLSRKADETVST